MHKIKSLFNTLSTPPSVEIGLGRDSRGFWPFLRNSKCRRAATVVIPNSFRNLFIDRTYENEMLNQLCIQAHSSSLRCGGSLCKVQHDKLYNAPHCKSKKYAFTLAEVLITLTIIGVIAALTIPNLMQKYTEHATVSQLKKTYSILQQAFGQAQQEYGTPDVWIKESDDTSTFFDFIVPYLKIAKTCTVNDFTCVSNIDNFKELKGKRYAAGNAGFPKRMLLQDGSAIATVEYNYKKCDDTHYNNGETRCTYFLVDTNGVKGPNTWGKDVFGFSLTKTGFHPMGGEGPRNRNFYYHNDTDWGCQNKNASGFSCAKWVIYKGNMDYLHKDTSW